MNVRIPMAVALFRPSFCIRIRCQFRGRVDKGNKLSDVNRLDRTFVRNRYDFAHASGTENHVAPAPTGLAPIDSTVFRYRYQILNTPSGRILTHFLERLTRSSHCGYDTVFGINRMGEVG